MCSKDGCFVSYNNMQTNHLAQLGNTIATLAPVSPVCTYINKFYYFPLNNIHYPLNKF